ncbi:hypothetical protein CK203_049470 [Vitis vinifera]|uniref:Uncharacterized protein n=1 Tax=Vitis vinifera TaxID=29760 RepID=A0A438HAT6_VITVI|nr:hypothetical protein CK203_049470 [Vitis vinifera]
MLFHFFPEIAMPNFRASGVSIKPQLERKRMCREVFTLDKWTNMTAYRTEHPELPQPQQLEDPHQLRCQLPGEHLENPYMRRSMPHIADTDRDSKQPCSGDVSYSFSAGAYFDHLDSAHYHPEAASAPSGSSISY